jgi:hypothetical protein
MTTITVNTDRLAEAMADATAQLKLWTDRRAQLAEQLLAAHAAGDVPTKFEAAGCKFSLQQGRQTVVYPEWLTTKIKEMQGSAIVAGTTTSKFGKPYWTVTPAKEAG